MEKTMICLSDQLSMFYKDGKKPKVYARKGETIKIVSESGSVLIAENNKGERFPMRRENAKAN